MMATLQGFHMVQEQLWLFLNPGPVDYKPRTCGLQTQDLWTTSPGPVDYKPRTCGLQAQCCNNQDMATLFYSLQSMSAEKPAYSAVTVLLVTNIEILLHSQQFES